MRVVRRSGGFRERVAVLIVSVLAGAVVACSPSGPAGPAHPCHSTVAPGRAVVVVVSGTGDEPEPELPPQVQARLRAAAHDPVAADGDGAVGRSVRVVSADGRRVDIELTPRRANCAVEHGMQRESLIERNLAANNEAVRSVAATRELDLIDGLDRAVAGLPGGDLVVVSNGLSTTGALDLRQIGWRADPERLADQLRARDVVTGLLRGWRTSFVGLGGSAGPQPPLTRPVREALERYWSSICAAANGTCEIDSSPVSFGPPSPTAAVGPVVPVPGVTSVTGPDGRTDVALSDVALGFVADSVVLRPDARNVLRSLAATIADRWGAGAAVGVTVRGFVADPPGSTPRDLAAFSVLRARSVADCLSGELARLGSRAPVAALGDGPPPGVSARTPSGGFDEDIAVGMRTVVVTY